MKKVRLFKVSPGRWPWAEDRLFEDFVELRKVGIAVDGPYLKAKIMKYVPKTPGADPDKVKTFKNIFPRSRGMFRGLDSIDNDLVFGRPCGSTVD